MHGYAEPAKRLILRKTWLFSTDEKSDHCENIAIPKKNAYAEKRFFMAILMFDSS